MNSYLIQHKIKTLSQLWKPIDHRGFHFSNWNFTFQDGATGDAWIAEKIIQATSAVDAINAFRRELIPITDRTALSSQCFTTAELEAFNITKQNGNTSHIFFFRYTNERRGVPLHFGEEEISSLTALEQYEQRGDVFRYLREAINASTFYTRLAMLLAVLEAIAGQTETDGRMHTKKEYRRNEILPARAYHDRLHAD